MILNVDDNEPLRYAKSRVLRAAGFAVIEAGTGQEALRLVRELHPDLALLDVRLPDMNGIDLARTITHKSLNKSTNMELLASAMVT